MSEVDRWRLMLGRFSAKRLGATEPGSDGRRMEEALEYLYGREYDERDLRGDGGDPGGGSLDESQPHLVTWLGEVRELFPRETSEVIEKHALDRYGLVGLVSDPETLERLEPSQELLRTLLTLKGHLQAEVLEVARRIIRQVVEELKRRLELEVRRAMAGRLDQHRHSPMKIAANFDPRGTIRRNLKNYDPETERLVLAEPLFFQRNARRLRWDVVICVDQSGSMVDSVIHSAVMAGILAGLPTYRVRLVVFDTSVVDLSDQVEDPVEVLMQVQLGGGTDIAKALRYCGQLVENPDRTVLVLVTDFEEGGSVSDMLRSTRELAEARVTMLGLAALDGQAHPFYNRAIAQRMAECGMQIAALTPGQLASWLVEATS